ncbi:FdhF/YdeP family oxidoreductase [Devosia aurantiaca]|uniref:FdhF/YdeP family oxidoreductase n=1 Tax=Devosia aurantiaca TaxID=2714858 RepID=A0A6M1S9I1_9HYPH|nr:FdhF/YdeP family oxidoreductase [Devosia aurantiaca]NGP16467.1 FdhF/YdeP family oxidoreductase [Devosia aurantiaca]
MTMKTKIYPYKGPAGGWGSAKSVAKYLGSEHLLVEGPGILLKQNKPDGFACVSCAWAKPVPSHPAEFCENGAKATAWELTKKRVTPEFFQKHTVSKLQGWSDFQLEEIGRLTTPMRYDAATDKYVAVEWDEAFAAIGRELAAIREIDPKRTVFYASGRASLETSYMYALMARLYGNNNLPDSSNMCHESTSVGLKESIGVPVGTVVLDDFDHADALFFFGQNVGSNSPRMLHQLKDASDRGATIVAFNPLRERGLERFTDPQNPIQMATRSETPIAREYFQVRPGGDMAVVAGMCRWLIEADKIDHGFIAEHTHGFAEFSAWVMTQDWADIERESGLRRNQIELAARLYAEAPAAMIIYGMGITQHKLGVQSVQMLVNLALMRGNIGRPGAGICPVRGHSNVQGQRTVGIADNPELVPLDLLEKQYGFSAPREHGLTTVDTCKGIIEGTVDAFIGLGGNFLRAVPDHGQMEAAWPRLRLTVQVATKLNRGHLFNGRTSYLLPCLGRIEKDRQATGEQIVTVEDSTAVIHRSKALSEPASKDLLSEPKIVAEIARATLPFNPKVPWDEWVGDYGKVRDAIAATYPDQFFDFNERMKKPEGFRRPIAASHREWKTKSGKAQFTVPEAINASFDTGQDKDVLRLVTLRSNDQFNTTVYGYDDRFRGIHGTRDVLLLNAADMKRYGISEGQEVGLATVADDGVDRWLGGLRAVTYNIPEGSCGGYYPECNVLIPVYQHAQGSKVPAAKSVPVRLVL